jgi:hypothetical protein
MNISAFLGLSTQRMDPGCGTQDGKVGKASHALVERGLFSGSDSDSSQIPPMRLETLPAQPGRCVWACAHVGPVPGLASVADRLWAVVSAGQVHGVSQC